MPKAYVMIHLEITNREEFISGFSSNVPALVAEFGGKPLTPGPDAEVHFLENQVTDRQADVHAIFEFPDKNQHSLGVTVKDTRLSCPTGRTTQPTLILQS